jgi:integrase
VAHARGDGWVASTVVEGRRKQRRFLTRSAAEAWERRHANDRDLVRAGLTTWRDIERRDRIVESCPLEDAIAAYLVEKLGDATAPHRKDCERMLCRLLAPRLGGLVGDITAGEIERALRKIRQAGRTNRTHNAYLISARAFLRWARERSMIADDPTAGLRLLPVPYGGEWRCPKRAFSPTEAIALLSTSEVIESGRRTWYLMRLLTGLRGTETLRLRRDDLLDDDGLWYIRVRPEVSKTRQLRLVPLADVLSAELLLTRGLIPMSRPLFTRAPNIRTLRADLERASVQVEVGGRSLCGASFRLSWDSWLKGLMVPLPDIMSMAGRVGTGGAALTVWAYTDQLAALPRWKHAVDNLWTWLVGTAQAESSAPVAQAPPENR